MHALYYRYSGLFTFLLRAFILLGAFAGGVWTAERWPYFNYHANFIFQAMSEFAKDIPTWAWGLLFMGAGIIITGLFTVLVWFLRRFLDDNKESWKEIKEAVGDLVKVTTKHDTKIFELEKDVLEMRSDIR